MLRVRQFVPSAGMLKIGRMAMSSVADAEALFSSKGAARLVTLNRPKALNALNLNMVRLIYPQMKAWEKDPEVGLILIKGTGEKAFCAGGDVLAVTRSAKNGGTTHMDFFHEEYMLNYLIGTYAKPYVALIDGITMGGGCGLSIHGTFRVATERTMLAMPETALGLFPDVGGTYFLPRLQGKLGMFLGLTGYRLKGADVFHAGLATHFVESKHLEALEDELSKLPTGQCRKDVINNTIKKFASNNVPEFSLKSHLSSINSTFDADSVENIIAKLEACGSDFSLKQVALMKKMSPTSLKVTHRQLVKGGGYDLGTAFFYEHRMCSHFLNGHDFYEGCRAILVDKDNNPKWNPKSLEEVSCEAVDNYFTETAGIPDLILQAPSAQL